MDVHVEHLNIMRIWNPTKSKQSLPNPNTNKSKKKSIRKSSKIDNMLYLNPTTYEWRVVILMGILKVKTLHKNICQVEGTLEKNVLYRL